MSRRRVMMMLFGSGIPNLLTTLRNRATYYENETCTTAILREIEKANLLERASIVLTPTAYDNGSMLSIKPENGDGDLDFQRSGNASRVDSSGNIVTESTNIPRIDYTDGCGSWLLEPQSTNLYLNSETLLTQSNATSASTYTVSFYGTGTITFSGTHTGTLVGTAADERVSATFTATSGTLVSTVSGTCEKGQLEGSNGLGSFDGSYATSYIPTNGAANTRLQDIANNSGDSSLINSTEGVLYAEIATLVNTQTTDNSITLTDGGNNKILFRYRNVNAFNVKVFVNGVAQAEANYTLANATDFNKIAIKWKLNDYEIFVNGISVFTDNNALVFPTNSLNRLGFADGTSNKFFGKTKCLAVWKEALTDEELAELTTI